MALAAGTIWEVRTTGNDANGGGFNAAGASPGTDYSQQDAAQVTIDGATVTCTVHTTTTQLNIVGAVVTLWNRNLIKITGGTMTAGTYEVTAVDTPNNRITVDRAAGTAAQTGTGTMGGAKASLGETVPLASIIGMSIWVKSGTYTMTTSTPGPAGPIVCANAATIKWEGYQTTRGDRGTKPVISAGAVTGISMISPGSTTSGPRIFNMTLDGNNGAANIVFVGGSGSRWMLVNCIVKNATTGITTGSGQVIQCWIDNCVSGVVSASILFSRVTGGTTGVTLASSQNAFFTYVSGCSGDGFLISGNGVVTNCVAYNCAGDGFDCQSNTGGCVVNSIALSNTGFGFNNGTAAANQAANHFINVAGFGNSALFNTGVLSANLDQLTLTGDPFVNAATGDFSLNTTAGAGAVCRAAGIDPYGQTSYLDTGVNQHQDPAGGSSSGAKSIHLGAAAA